MIEELILRNFRNYQSSEIQFSKGINILLGQNGQGKTNILEAIHLLVTGDSFRFGENETFIQIGQPESYLGAKIKIKDLDYEIRLQILKSRKNFWLNGKKITSRDINKKIQTVIFSPESLSAIKEGADLRRTLVDEALVSFDEKNLDTIREYRKALKSKNKVLKEYQEGMVDKNQTLRVLESLNPIFLKLATELTIKRVEVLKKNSDEFNNAMQYISKNTGTAEIRYEISKTPVIHFTHQDIHNFMQKRLFELSEAELASGTALVGPHKHDIAFLYNQKDSRFFCSQGQQRALILAFKMAQIVYHHKVHGHYPNLMLDDVLSELDEEKRESLIRFLQQIKTQIFLTTTDLKITGDLVADDCRVLEVKSGSLQAV